MNDLTIEQMIWSIRWAADYLDGLQEDDAAIKALRHCADTTENRAAIGNAVSKLLAREGVTEPAENYGLTASELGMVGNKDGNYEVEVKSRQGVTLYSGVCRNENL